jgi:hypothetical protein
VHCVMREKGVRWVQQKGSRTMSETQIVAGLVPALPAAMSFVRSVWPLAGLAVAVIVATAWTGFLALSLFLTIF